MTMTPLAWIVVMSISGGLLSVLVAAALSWAARPTWVPTLISYAIGALLGAAFLEVLPHAIEAAESPERAAMNMLAGILIVLRAGKARAMASLPRRRLSRARA
jgi:zinc and cadmium transporter